MASEATNNTTDTTANNTTDAQANAQAASSGAATDTAQNTSQAQSTATTTQDPKIAAALKTLEEAGVLGKDVLTREQFNGHMGAARKQWQADAQKAAQEATVEAQRKAQEEQGQFKPLYETAQAAIQEREAIIKEKDTLIASLSERVNAQINETIKVLPPLVREFDPGPDNLAARLEWYAKVQKHPEALRTNGYATGSAYPNGNSPVGHTRVEQGTQRSAQEITPPAPRQTF